MARRFNVDPGVLLPFREAFLARIDQTIDVLPLDLQLGPNDAPTLSIPACRAMKRVVLKHYVVTVVDKAATTFALVCKRSAASLVLHDPSPASGPSAFTPLPDQPALLLHTQLDQLQAMGYGKTGQGEASCVCWHSQDAQAGEWSSQVAILVLFLIYLQHIPCPDLVKALHPALEVLWHSMPFPLALRAQYAQHWVLQNSMAFIPVMNSWNSSHSDFQHFTTPTKLYTYDFERLYTNLDHVELKRRLCDLLGLISDLHPGPGGAPAYITVSRDGPATWRSGDLPNPTHSQTPDGPAHTFDLQSARAAVCFLFDHSYILVGDPVLR